MKTKPITSILITLLLTCCCGNDKMRPSPVSAEIVSDIGENSVTQFLFDNEGYTWMRARDNKNSCLFRTDGTNILHYYHNIDDKGSISSDIINDALIDENGFLWFATQKGVDRLDPVSGKIRHYSLDDNNSYVVSIARNNTGGTSIATRRYIMEQDPESGQFLKRIQMPYVTRKEPRIIFDRQDKLWAVVDETLICYSSDFKVLYSHSFKSLISESVYDGERYIWILTGGEVILVNTTSLHEQRADKLYPFLQDKNINNMLEVPGRGILLSNNKECWYYDFSSSMFTDGSRADATTTNLIDCMVSGATSLAIDKYNNVWEGLPEGGFRVLHSLNEVNSRYSKFMNTIRDNDIRSYSIYGHRCWMISGDRVILYDFVLDEIIDSKLLPESEGNRFVPYYITSDSNGSTMICSYPRSDNSFLFVDASYDGKIKFNKGNDQIHGNIAAFGPESDIYFTGTQATLFKQSHEDGSISQQASFFDDNACYASHINTLSDDRILICYTDHSPIIYNPNNGEWETIEIPNLNQAYFNTSAEDRHGNLWIGSTDNGLFHYETHKKTLLHLGNYSGDLIKEIVCDADGHTFVLDNNKSIFMFADGSDSPIKIWGDRTTFPKECHLFNLPDKSVAMVRANECRVFNKETLLQESISEVPIFVTLTSGDQLLTTFNSSRFPDGMTSIAMARKTEGLTLHLGLQNCNPGVIYSYYYNINGFPAGPRESFAEPDIPLYGVNKPNNKVEFFISTNNPETKTHPFVLKIKMSLLPYEIALPIAIMFLLALSFYMFILARRRMLEAARERTIREMTEKVNMDNIDFFANISHEFRTPLTLIEGAIPSIDADNSTEETRHAKSIIKRNADRMLKLVSQMLDFNKLDHGELKLKVKAEDIAGIISEVKSNFDIGAESKSIDLSLSFPQNGINGWVDKDKLEKILYNLLSNAMKYTPPGGAIEIKAEKIDNRDLFVSVSDSGIGIPEEDLQKIFTRFYRGEGTQKSGGTGIGLYYTKALVTLHHGQIKADIIKQDGHCKGSVFSFSIPIEETEYNQSEKGEQDDKQYAIDNKENLSEFILSAAESKSIQGKATVLIIDDDYEVVYFLKSLLSSLYNVQFRFDAMSGYKKIEESQPDIIICDVMMVDMDGIQLCKMVKGNILMSHIPFILLTAKSTMEDQIISLDAGADAYVVKPFDPGYLKALIKSMLYNRRILLKMLNTSISAPKPEQSKISARDQAFIDKLYEVMEAQLKKGELDIDGIAETLNVSRSKFYYKVKALTGQTPNEFFTIYKLNYAADLIKKDKYKLSAIADMLGFSSPSHFSQLFKKQFGVLPSQYPNQNNAQ